MQFNVDDPGIVKFAATEAGLATATTTFECQVTRAELVPEAQTQTLPATRCRGESDIASPSKWTLELEILQDWVDPDGVSFFLYENDSLAQWFSIAYDSAAAPVATGEVTVVASSFLGSSVGPLVGTASLPCKG